MFAALALVPLALHLDVQPAQSRRAILGQAAAAAVSLAPLAANARSCARVEAGGGQGDADCINDKVGSKTSFTTYKKPRDQVLVNVAGSYADPMHPGCARRIILQGSSVFISGADEDGTKFKLTGKLNGNLLTADFSPKVGHPAPRSEAP